MSARRIPVIVVAGHPALGLAVSTTGRFIADALHASGRFDVHYVGRGAVAARSPFHAVPVESDADDAFGERTVPRLVRELRAAHPDEDRFIVVATGPIHRTHAVIRRLTLAGLRNDVVIVGHAPVEAAPLPGASLRILREFDVVVPYNEFGYRAIVHAADGGALPPIAEPISLPVPDVFRPLDATSRSEARRALVDASPNDLVIGTFARNVGAKRLGLVTHLVRLLARGEYGHCANCNAISSDRLDPVTFASSAVSECRICGGPLERALPRPNVRAYIHTDTPEHSDIERVEGFDLDALVARHGIGSIVRIDRSMRHGLGVSTEETARRMAACDVHLLPLAASSWEVAVLETGACGVPSVVTNVAGPADYAGPFSLLVEPATWQARASGVMLAEVATDDALTALVRLADDPLLRQRLGAAGPAVAEAHGVQRFGDRWIDLLPVLDRRHPSTTATTAR
ncbi:MAG: glycosyltransferase [Acidimicrobiia bacterium]